MPRPRPKARSAAAAASVATPPPRVAEPDARPSSADAAATRAGEWSDLAAQWSAVAAQWQRWWTQASSPLAPPSAPRDATPVAAGTPRVPPDAAATIASRHAARFAQLWQAVAQSQPGEPPADVAATPPGDRRFAAREWRELPYFSLLRQSYLLYADYLNELAAASTLPDDARRRLQFVTRQYLAAIAPTNFVATNPDVMRRAIATEGRSLLEGLAHLGSDLARGRITMTDERAFEVGRNLAVTPGQVVHRNALIEVIQYAPTTSQVQRRPLLVVPPCINKYYILDLQPSNSFVRHAVEHGHTVFMVSWRNVPPELGHLTWDDYLAQGVIEAIGVARSIAGSDDVNALGFCVGGTLLACALAVLAARGDRSVASATFLTTMLDFADPGEIGVYITPEFLDAREPALQRGERMPGSDLATAFATLRPNDLVWNYVVGNYLKGETPPAFDLLYWNGDSASLPGPMYAYYLRQMYFGNRLREPGALTMCGQRVDLSRVRVPAYVLASREDHIVPWRSAYRTTSLLGGASIAFVLAASGHIAGVVNSPVPPKRHHWVAPSLPKDPDAWLASATEVAGSWWPNWLTWIARHGGGERRAPDSAGNARYPALEPAPGRYVVEPMR